MAQTGLGLSALAFQMAGVAVLHAWAQLNPVSVSSPLLVQGHCVALGGLKTRPQTYKDLSPSALLHRDLPPLTS